MAVIEEIIWHLAALFDFVGLANFLETKLKSKVDLVSERSIRSEIRDQILEEAVEVCCFIHSLLIL